MRCRTFHSHTQREFILVFLHQTQILREKGAQPSGITFIKNVSRLLLLRALVSFSFLLKQVQIAMSSRSIALWLERLLRKMWVH